ncbi:MAG: thioesterase [Bacteroidetes bacterium GWA2_32_17]|nr:MAG: thioesterase [Bacteroidetes bacterium GWA2_32_17]
MSIWFKEYKLEDLQDMITNTLAETLGIKLTEITSDSLKCKMEVVQKTKQSRGILHGGASAALCETLGSIASNLIVDPEKYFCLGLDINASHIRPVSSGFIYAEAKPVHLGKKTHVWRIDITNEIGKLVCTCRLTMAVVSVLEKKEK